ncbi:hypothetical protein ACT009_15450 [Sphingomonas sp. Tas61C01]|uniref:hypothetical protein n=1 Tax=Sphingomonas sp. Tas61C01 TaxID=3458297 RepID=UPI00403EE8F1
MGKKKDKKAAKAAAAGATTKPAGFAIPDELMKQGAALLETANTPAGREMLAAGLTMAAAAASAALTKRTTDTPDAAAAHGAAKEPPVLADALNQAADALMKRFLGPKAG